MINKEDTRAPIIRLAHVPGAQGDNNLLGQRGVEQLEEKNKPALLVSYVYIEKFLQYKDRYAYRDWALDSGAFSAYQSGTVIKLQDYIDCCKKLMDTDSTLSEIFALDVIGNWKASVRNTFEMWKQGVPAIPTFHFGEPWDVLMRLADRFDKIAIGGCAGRDKRHAREAFVEQCFARVWPKKVHGFGFGEERHLMKFPFHSTDATTWELGVCGFGRWNHFGHIGKKGWVRGTMPVYGGAQNLKLEIEWYLNLERKAQERWKTDMEKLKNVEHPSKRYPQLYLGLGFVRESSIQYLGNSDKGNNE